MGLKQKSFGMFGAHMLRQGAGGEAKGATDFGVRLEPRTTDQVNAAGYG
jgi:hypothetical protein